MSHWAILFVAALLCLPVILLAAEAPANLLKNADFCVKGTGDLPADWIAWRPLLDQAACPMRQTEGGLRMETGQEPFSVGAVEQSAPGIRGGQAYRLRAEAQLSAIASPFRSVMVRLNWTCAGQPLTPHGWMVRGPVVTGTTAVFDDVLIAPSGADGASVRLEVKWPQGGSVLWRSVSMVPCETPTPRKTRLGAVYLKPQHSTPEKNLDLWCEQIDAAGQLKLDAVCLGEAIGEVGTSKNPRDLAEAVPGPTTERLGAAAKKNNLYVVATLSERDGTHIYNTGVLLDREGRLAGKYRKTHLPREEWLKGVTPGTEYPVFQTDFGPVAIQICYDWFFPAVAETFALKGARVLFAPTWGTTFRDEDGRAEGETVFRVRSRDNGLVLVACVYDGSSLVIDPLGRILATRTQEPGIAWAEVDLDRREPLFWVGSWPEVGPRDRMPETYGPLTAAPEFPGKR